MSLGGNGGGSKESATTAANDGGRGGGTTSAGGTTSYPADWKPYTGPVPILEYHAIQPPVSGAAYPQLFVPQADFVEQMKWLDDHGYEGVTLDQVEDAWYKGGELPPKPVVLSFDDGYLSQYVAAFPALQHFHWPGVLNLVTKGADLPDDDVKRCWTPGWELASHTVHHLDLTTLDSSQLHEEVASSRKILQRSFRGPGEQLLLPGGPLRQHGDRRRPGGRLPRGDDRGPRARHVRASVRPHPDRDHRWTTGSTGSCRSSSGAGRHSGSRRPAGEHRLALGGEGRRALARGRAARRAGRVQRPGSAGSASRPSTASTSGASPATRGVRENRARGWPRALGIDPSGVLIGRQVHGAELQPHDGPTEPGRFADPAPGASRRPTGTSTDRRRARRPLVLVADCLPVALAGPDGVAMIHCGWRGLAAGIVERGVEAVEATGGGDRPRHRPLLLRGRRRGPRRLRARAGSRPGRMLDLREVARAPAGARRASSEIEVSELCTSCEPELFFSHRRDSGRTGRQAGLVVDGASRCPGSIHGLEAGRIRGATSSGCASARAPGSRSSPRRKYVPLEEMGALAEAGVDAGRREPPPGPRGEARALGRRLRLGLHRQPPEPQGQGGSCRSCA